MNRLAISIALGGALFAATPAHAQSVAGPWRLETSTFDDDCKIVGRMTILPTKTPNVYTCKFVSEQICGPLNGDLYIKVEQTCSAEVLGRQVSIKSQVARVLERRPKTPPGDDPMDGYLADNFFVVLSKSMQEMIGGHYDEIRKLKVKFWREEELVG